MDRYVAWRVFQQVAMLESFSAAGRRLGLSAPAISKNIAALEAHLGVRLINRSTRRMALTDEGRIYLTHLNRGLEALAEAEQALDPLRQQPQGLLRVTAPMSVSLTRLSKRIPDFLAQHPAVQLDLVLDDRRIDLIREGFDLAIRGSDRLEDSSLVARKLADMPHVLCASPAYLQQHGRPSSPAALGGHRLIRFSLSGHADSWTFRRPMVSPQGPDGQSDHQGIAGRRRVQQGTSPVSKRDQATDHARMATVSEEVQTVPVNAIYSVSSSLAVRDALLAGLGVSLIPRLYVEDELNAGHLQALLPDWQPVSTALYVVYPGRHYLSPRVRAFVDFLGRVFDTA
ncbi:MAG: LysR family transcriptional regulator [Lautropia sp.]|nr:LysR family transcriptional regulator [Lautropia sp.]